MLRAHTFILYNLSHNSIFDIPLRTYTFKKIERRINKMNRISNNYNKFNVELINIRSFLYISFTLYAPDKNSNFKHKIRNSRCSKSDKNNENSKKKIIYQNMK